MQPQSNLTLATHRLLLRPVEPGDVELVWPSTSDPEIARYMAWEPHRDKNQTADFLRAEACRLQEGRGITWGVLKENSFCGIVSLIGLLRSHRGLTYNKAELAYWLNRKYQGQGIMTEAGRRILEFAFGELGLHKVCVSHFSHNLASEKLIKRLGFRYIGEQIEEFQKNGVWHNHKTYELLAREFHGGRLMES